MTIVDVITVTIICVSLVILLALMAFLLIDFLKSIEGRRMVRSMKDVCSTILFCMSPSTPLQKEIREEERTIKELKRQKADMERLAALKRERDALFEELGEADFKARTGNSTEAEKHVIAFVDGMKLPHAFANERKAIEHIEKYYPAGVEIKWKEVGL